jgi:ABC-type dipeptide/oligopeptide/nickel transport system permease component
MARFIARRLAQSLAVLFAMSVLVFLAVFAIGNPVDILLGLPLGILAGRDPGGWTDRTIMAGNTCPRRIPSSSAGTRPSRSAARARSTIS